MAICLSIGPSLGPACRTDLSLKTAADYQALGELDISEHSCHLPGEKNQAGEKKKLNK